MITNIRWSWSQGPSWCWQKIVIRKRKQKKNKKNTNLGKHWNCAESAVVTDRFLLVNLCLCSQQQQVIEGHAALLSVWELIVPFFSFWSGNMTSHILPFQYTWIFHNYNLYSDYTNNFYLIIINKIILLQKQSFFIFFILVQVFLQISAENSANFVKHFSINHFSNWQQDHQVTVVKSFCKVIWCFSLKERTGLHGVVFIVIIKYHHPLIYLCLNVKTTTKFLNNLTQSIPELKPYGVFFYCTFSTFSRQYQQHWQLR